MWNSGVFTCTHEGEKWDRLKWVNPGPGTLYVRGFYAWSSVTYDKVVDIRAHFGNFTTGNSFGNFAYDRYNNPGAPVDIYRQFAPDYISVLPGQDLTLEWSCKNWLWETQGEAEGQFIYWVYWSDVRPR
jgi:hypothetical protein